MNVVGRGRRGGEICSSDVYDMFFWRGGLVKVIPLHVLFEGGASISGCLH